MPEGFELVRTVRQHLRRGAALLEEGSFGEALAEVESALALDPQSLPAQALRDRIWAARAAANAPITRSQPEPTPRPFVPHGVNAASWRGFEQRITERRFRALLETINTSIVAGDPATARVALEEARELRPDATSLDEFEARVAALPVAVPVPTKAGSAIWVRAMGAAALFLIGVSLLLGLEWMRPPQAITTTPTVPVIVAPELPAAAPTQDARPSAPPDLGAVPVAANEEEVPAIVTPPEPILRPAGTSGTIRPTIESRAFAMRDAMPPAVERTIERRPVEEDEEPPSGPLGEVPDEFVASPRNLASAAPAAGSAVGSSNEPADTPVNADSRGRDALPAAAMASAVSIPAGIDQQMRVEDVLRRYARAYGQLDAGAARAVWPSVDERALARAFQNLSSQQVSFEDCEIDIRGAVANASCRGQASYAPKVGNRERRTEPRTWRFELHRDGDAWTIDNVDMRRANASYR